MISGFQVALARVGGQSYIIVGAAAMLAGYTRLTYSLAVIMLETTQSINMFLPLIISIMVSHGTAKVFNRSLYEYAIRSKQMPLLRNHLPKGSENMRVRDALEGYELEVVESVCSVGRLADVCRNEYHTIPVVNMAGKLIGLMPKNFIITLIENHCWYEMGMRKSRMISNYYQTY